MPQGSKETPLKTKSEMAVKNVLHNKDLWYWMNQSHLHGQKSHTSFAACFMGMVNCNLSVP